MRDTRLASWRGALAAVVLYLVLAVAATWPLSTRLGSSLTLGTEPTSTVPAASAWALWWNADRVAHGWSDYWNAPIFAPSSDAFALSEAMPLPGAVTASLVWWKGPAFAANLWTLAALVLNGVAGRALARRLGVSPPVATAAGAATTLLPFVHDQLGVLTLVGVFGIVWSLDSTIAVDRAASADASPRAALRSGTRLGAALAVTYLCCAQYGALLALAAAPAALVLWATRWRERARWIAAATAIVLALVAIAPVIAAQRRAAAEHPTRRLPVQIAAGAASVTAWIRHSAVEVVPQPGTPESVRRQRALSPGVLKLILALIGVATTASVSWPALGRGSARAIARPVEPRAVWFLAGTAVAAFLWSTLPRVGGGWPFAALMSELPGLAQIRSVGRIGTVAQIAVVALAFIAVDQMRLRAASRPGRLAAWALALAAAIELWPRPPRMEPSPDLERWRPVLDWIETTVPPQGIILHLPMPATVAVADFADTGRWMLMGTQHSRRMINGYSSTLPFDHYRLWKLLLGFPDPASTSALVALGVDAVVIENDWLDDSGHRTGVAAMGWRVALAAPEPGVTIFVR